MNKYLQQELNHSHDSIVYNFCYNVYMKENEENKDSSIKQQDNSDDFENIINTYDYQVKNGKNTESNYYNLQDNIGKII